MKVDSLLEFINLFFTGIFAGSLFIVTYGIRKSISSLDEQPQIKLRQSLIRRLRVMIPAAFLLTFLSAISAAVAGGFGPGYIFRFAGVLSLLVWVLLTLPGSVPINQAVLSWQPGSLPANWQTQIKLWERFDTARTWAAAASFAFMLTALAFRLANR